MLSPTITCGLSSAGLTEIQSFPSEQMWAQDSGPSRGLEEQEKACGGMGLRNSRRKGRRGKEIGHPVPQWYRLQEQ